MLTRFSVKNYKNFEKEIVLDFRAVNNYKFNMYCIKDNVLSKTLLMGPNGSGKTNIGYALFDIVYTLTDNGFDARQKDPQSFINGNSKENSAEFSYEFQLGGYNISYGYGKTSPDQMIREKLQIDSETIFECNGSRRNFEGMEKIGAGDLRTDRLNGSMSVLRYIANNTPQAKNSPIALLMDFVNRMLYFKSVQDGNSYIGYSKGVEAIDQYIIKNGLIGEFQKFLKDMAEIEMKLDTVEVPGLPAIFVQRLENKLLVFQNIASSGTLALELLFYWGSRFEKVSFLFIDEFDAYYHFDLARNVVEYLTTFADMQSMVTSHNTYLVDNGLLRPDCYLQIKDGSIRSLAQSTDREIREGHNLEKMYRNGEFDE